jgi:hypothetical protein
MQCADYGAKVKQASNNEENLNPEIYFKNGILVQQDGVGYLPAVITEDMIRAQYVLSEKWELGSDLSDVFANLAARRPVGSQKDDGSWDRVYLVDGVICWDLLGNELVSIKADRKWRIKVSG